MINYDINLKRKLAAAQKGLTCDKTTCLHPGCTKPVVASHSIAKGGPLKSISVNNHVYAIHPNLTQTHKNPTANAPMLISRIGTNKAGTFYAFCGNHDNTLFKDADSIDEPPTYAMISQVHIRALAHEYYMKRFVGETCLALADLYKGSPHEFHIYQAYNRLGSEFSDIANKDLKPEIQEQILLQDDKNNLQSVGIAVDKCLDIACCTVIAAHGELFTTQQISNATFHVYPYPAKTLILAIWRSSEDRINRSYFLPVSNKSQSCQIVNDLCFIKTENTIISPRIWDATSDAHKMEIRLGMRPPGLNHRKWGIRPLAQWEQNLQRTILN